MVMLTMIYGNANYQNTDMFGVATGSGNQLYIADRNNGLVNYTDNNNITFTVPNSPASPNASCVFHNGTTFAWH